MRRFEISSVQNTFLFAGTSGRSQKKFLQDFSGVTSVIRLGSEFTFTSVERRSRIEGRTRSSADMSRMASSTGVERPANAMEQLSSCMRFPSTSLWETSPNALMASR